MPETRVNEELAYLLTNPDTHARRRIVRSAIERLSHYLVHPDLGYVASAINLLHEALNENPQIYTTGFTAGTKADAGNASRTVG